MLMPLVTTLLLQAAGPQKLGRLMSVVSLPVAVVPIFGPLISGLIIEHVSWRWVFYVNVPICLVGLVLAWRGLPAAEPADARARPKLDLAGLLLLCPSLAGILYGLAQVSTAGGFGHPKVLIPLLAGVALLAGFIWHALATTGKPLVNLRLFRSRPFAGASALMFLAGLSIYGAMLLLPLHFQQARGYSALTAGLLLVPQGVGTILPRVVVGKLTDRLGARPIALAGMVLAAIGTISFTVERRPVAEVARSYGVARSWIYTLLARYRAEGEAAFEPRSRRPKTSPAALSAESAGLLAASGTQCVQAAERPEGEVSPDRQGTVALSSGTIWHSRTLYA